MTHTNTPKLLVVDDRPENICAMEHVLREVDVELFKAESGNDALALTLHHDFALILLDVQMPVMDGYEVATLLRERAQTADVPVIFVTAIDQHDQHEIKGYKSGAMDFVFKPINSDILRSKVRVFLELHSKREALRQKNEELQDFAHLAAHDLKAPLRAIRSFSEMLRDDLREERFAEAGELLDDILVGSQRMNNLIEGLLEYATAGRSSETFEQVNLDEVAEQAIALLSQPIQEANATVTVDSLPTVLGNKSGLIHMMQNIIANAIKFRGEAAPVVHVSVLGEGTYWQFSVKDNGIGIAPEHHEKIFAALKRLHSAEAYEGTGLGLAACRRIIEQHGGRIWVESQENEGSIFHFTLAREI